MIAVAPHYESSNVENRELEYLLLGDRPQTSLWLLAILDMILVGRPRLRNSALLPLEMKHDPFQQRSRSLESGSLIEKLRRLRDRVAHRSGHATLANEIREDLREVMFDRMSSAGCLYDA
jgi:hypothetical protein